MREKLQIAHARSNIYGFLVLFYRREPNLTLLRRMREPDFIQALSRLGIEFEKVFLEKSEQEILDEMIEEYTRLFIGPGKHISPHESVHCEGEGFLWGDSTVRVKNFIESSGLRYCSDFRGIPDHISVELEFMHRLVEAEVEARRKNDLTKLKKIQSLQRRFINEHISRWIPQFTNKIVRETKLDFYRKIAQLTKEFIFFEEETLECYGKE